MRKNASAGKPPGGQTNRSTVGAEFAFGLIEEIRPLAAEHGVGSEALAGALREAVFEVDQNKKEVECSAEERNSYLLGLILWKVFARGSELWITPKTAAGNDVPVDLLVMAYTMWRRAVSFAASCGVGSSDAAEALAQTTHATADQLARDDRSGESNRIRSVHNYLFAAFMYAIFRVAGKQGSKPVQHVQLSGLNDRSDEGAFHRALESSILCRELLKAMPPKGRRAAIARYFMGFGWPETAETLKTSVNAAQKAQSVGLRRAFETCMRELRNMGRPNAESDTPLMKNKKPISEGE